MTSFEEPLLNMEAPSFGQWLKESRKALDLTQEDLARLVGCAVITIRKIEAETLRPSRQIAERLAEFLAIPIEQRASFVAMARSMVPTSQRKTSVSGDAPKDVVPYRGLVAFQEQDADLFFGREMLIPRLLDHVQSAPFLAVLGPSGSGKSSLVFAGLLSALRRGAIPGSEQWRYLVFRPGPRPLEALATALADLLSDDASLPAQDDQLLVWVAEQLRGAHGLGRLVLLIDQFEELWTQPPEEQLCCSSGRQEQFIRLLLDALAEPNDQLLLIITMRADFLHHAAEHAELANLIGEYDLIVSPMTNSELLSAIERPAQIYGGSFEPGLADELVAQVVGRAGSLPLLEYTLLELWKTRRADGTMTWEAFHSLGGVEGSLAARADAILAEHYDLAKQSQLRQLLVRLVQPGEGIGDIRRAVPLDDLVPAGGTLEEVQLLLQPLVNQRLLTTNYDSLSGEETVELSHEALIRAWPRFGGWLSEAHEDLRLQLRLEQAAKEWEANQTNPDFLWSGLRLEHASEWVQRAQPLLTNRDQHFLAASREQEQARVAIEEEARRERERLALERAVERQSAVRLRRLLALIIGLFVLALTLAGFALISWQNTQTAEMEAVQARDEATALAHAGAALFEIDQQPERALLLSLAAISSTSAPYPPLIAHALYRSFSNAAIRRSLNTGASIRTLAWSPDGRLVLAGGEDGRVLIWSVETGTLVMLLEGHAAPIRSVAWRPDGRQVVVGDAAQVARIWDIERAAVVHVLRGHTQMVSAVAWSPDGRCVLTGSYDETARLWDATTGAELRVIKVGTAVRSVGWSPSGERFLTAGDDMATRLWDTASGTEVLTLKGHSQLVAAAVWSPDGRHIATGSGDGTARIWDAVTGAALQTFEGHVGWVWAVAWHPDGQRLLTGSFDGTVRIWSSERGEVLRILRGHQAKVWSVGWSSDGQRLASGSDDGVLRLWDAATGVIVYPSQASSIQPGLLQWSPNGRWVATAGDDGRIHIWDLPAGQTVRILKGHSRAVVKIAWDSQSRQLISSGVDRTVRGWDVGTGTEIWRWSYPVSTIWAIAWSIDDRRLAIGTADGQIVVRDVMTRDERQLSDDHATGVQGLAWHPQGRWLASGHESGEIHIWDSVDGRLHYTLRGHAAKVWNVAWHPDGQLLASVSDDGTVRVWEAISGTEVRRLSGHTGGVLGLDWSPDGRQLLSGGDDGTARIWDTATGAEVRILEGHTFVVSSAAWGPDGRQVLTESGDGSVSLWLVSTEQIVADVAQRVCNLFTDDQIRDTIRSWRGCEVELKAQALRE